jgi:Zn-dependent protease with chaperone function
LRIDISSAYIRVFLRGRPFESPEFDLLAERMNAASLLERNPKRRYYKTNDILLAMSLGNKVLFAKEFHDSLSADQKLAILAHEFGHIRDGDNRNRAREALRLGLLALAILPVVYLMTGSLVLGSVSSSIAFLSTLELARIMSRGRHEEMETRCDKVAVTYVGPGPLEGSLALAETFLVRGKRRMSETGAKGVHPAQGDGLKPPSFLARRIKLIQGYAKTLTPPDSGSGQAEFD